jgi:hypothetical protein
MNIENIRKAHDLVKELDALIDRRELMAADPEWLKVTFMDTELKDEKLGKEVRRAFDRHLDDEIHRVRSELTAISAYGAYRYREPENAPVVKAEPIPVSVAPVVVMTNNELDE